MVLIVNTTENTQLTDEIRRGLSEKNTEFEIVEAADMKISHCIGCNNCWLKTPGVCSIKDDYEIILKKIVKADQMWVISDTALGFINHKGKNIFDRILPVLTMFLEIRGDQMRHVMRYDRRFDVGVIYQGDADRAYLNRWNERCALNMDGRALGAYPADCIKEAVACMQ